MKKVSQAQHFLQERKLDGWLLYDFHGNNPLARTFLSLLPHQMTTRRFFYWIPAHGTPQKLVHAIEAEVLDHCPGDKQIYLSWQSLEEALKKMLHKAKTIAMEYSPRNAIPYVSRVDAGTVHLLQSFGHEVVSSADFLPHFTAVLTEEQMQSHLRAAQALEAVVEDAWKWIGDHLLHGRPITEYDVQQHILHQFKERDLVADHAPIVAVNAHSADPHFEPMKERSFPIRKGDFILIDLWAKEKAPQAVYGDITRVGVAASKPSPRQQEIFHIVRTAQKKGVALIRERFSRQQRVEGWEVDEIVRAHIREAGYGAQFIHRTGHSIETDLHGSGAHLDNLEMHDVRPLLPATCFSVEPGIYLRGEFGVRLEHDVLIHKDGAVAVTGGEQNEIRLLL